MQVGSSGCEQGWSLRLERLSEASEASHPHAD